MKDEKDLFETRRSLFRVLTDDQIGVDRVLDEMRHYLLVQDQKGKLENRESNQLLSS